MLIQIKDKYMIKKTLGSLVIMSALVLAGCVLVVNASTVTGDLNTGLNTNVGSMDGIVVAAPTLSPAASTYTSAQTVTLSASGATKICYTTDDTTPSCATSITCTTGTALASGGTITISSTDTIKSAACYNNNSTGPVATSAYTINISSNSGGGGGGSTVSSCSSISYSDWGACNGSFQFRQVSSRTPSGCSLTTAQQLSLQRACVADSGPVQSGDDSGQTPVSNDSGSELGSQANQTSDVDVQAVMDQERALVQRSSTSLTNRLSGRILLQVEEKGEAWYVEPTTKEKHFMGRPVDAFSMMRQFGLGISNANFAKFTASGVPARFAGRIFIKVEEAGEAYYVNPVDLKMHYLGRPDDAFRIMKELALGISNDNLRQIQVAD